MPELPEVETIKTALAQSVGCCRIVRVEVRNPALREPVPTDLSGKIEGARISGYERRAKYILIHLDNKISLIWHMGMSGKVLICDTLPNPLNKHDHLIIQTDKGYVLFCDPRRFGVFTYCPTSELPRHRLLTNLGIEPLDTAFDGTFLHEALQRRKGEIKPALLDQKLVVGIGNIYASEALFEAGISPRRKACAVSRPESERLCQAIKNVLNRAIAAGGSTLRDYKKPDGSLGYFQNQHCVYNKTGQACPDCTCDLSKTKGIRRIVQAGRATFYCPRKQK